MNRLRTTTLRGAQLAHDNACDCCGPLAMSDAYEQFAEELEINAAFVDEAICNGDTYELAVAKIGGNLDGWIDREVSRAIDKLWETVRHDPRAQQRELDSWARFDADKSRRAA